MVSSGSFPGVRLSPGPLLVSVSSEQFGEWCSFAWAVERGKAVLQEEVRAAVMLVLSGTFSPWFVPFPTPGRRALHSPTLYFPTSSQG